LSQSFLPATRYWEGKTTGFLNQSGVDMSEATKQTHEERGRGHEHGKYLTFFLSQEEYGIQILQVRKIMGLTSIRSVPESPHYMRGVLNLRGEMIPVVELRARFGMEPAEDTEETCIVVVQIGGQLMGLLVDRVSEVLAMEDEDVVDAPDLGGAMDTGWILGMGKHEDRITLLLDMDAVFPAETVSELSTAA
jgi:purine-binding chemotaxis protein CheW